MENTNETMMLALAGMTVVLEYGLVLAAALADLWSGLRKARRRGEARRSEALRRTVSKLCQYYNVMLALTVVDAMQIGLMYYVRVACGWDAPLLPCFTVIGAIGIAAIEVKSIYEKAEEKTQNDMTAAVSMLLNALKTLNAGGSIDVKSIIEKRNSKNCRKEGNV